ncbi:hypothetical protein CNMCM6936_002663 [Aspergillus lentulus]|nr:hypothetical protein CNMCM6936_002663 [Aspergillus lentulus]
MSIPWPAKCAETVLFEAWTTTMTSHSVFSSEPRRRRSALACDTCRGRRTKCDGKRPKCSFCFERGKDCFYHEGQDLPPSPAELSRLWEQLDHITAVAQGRTSRNSPSHYPRQGSSSPTTHGKSSKFPFMILQSEAFMNLVGVEVSLPVRLEEIERGRHTLPAQTRGTDLVMADLEKASVHLHAFGEHIQTWYPILQTDHTENFIEASRSCFATSITSCASLLALAIGCVVGRESVAGTRQVGSESVYLKAATDMLPCVFEDSSPASAQCLLLFAIYHLCYAQPCQAHDFVAMASYKLQNYILNELGTENDTTAKALLLDLANSGIWSMAPFVSPPTIQTTSLPSSDLSYFVAEIAMRRMLQRCTWATSTAADGAHIYAPIVAAELERQLDEWLQLLPSHLSFGRASPTVGPRPQGNAGNNAHSAQVAFLRAQYFAFKASIYWPAVYEALTTGEPNGELVRHSHHFFTSYAEFVPCAAAAAAVCRPNLWTLCTSVFTISMAALVGLMDPCFAGFMSRDVANSLDLAVQVFDGVIQVSSPSLAEMGVILKERIQLYHSSPDSEQRIHLSTRYFCGSFCARLGSGPQGRGDHRGETPTSPLSWQQPEYMPYAKRPNGDIGMETGFASTMGVLFEKPPGTEGKAWPAILISGFVAFGGILFGYDTGTISGILAMPYWAETFSTGYRDSTGQLNVTSSQSSAIVSILSAGTFFGALGAAPMGDLIGRRWGIIASNGVFVLGVILQTIATSIPPFLAGRFFAGLGVGLISALVPLYQSETAPKWVRGFIVGSYQFAITIGLLLASVVNNATHNRTDSGSYRIPIAVQFAWSIILVAGMLILPETPRYLIKRDNIKAAARSLSKLRRLPEDHEAVCQELAEIQANHQYEVSLGQSGYIDCFRGNLLKRLVTGCLLQALQQLSGINFIIYYGTQFFKNSGIRNEFVITLVINCVNVGSTIPGLYAIDKWGRRPVLLTGAIGMAVSQLIVAVLGTTTTGQDGQGNIIVHDAAAQKAAIAFICIYIFFFAASWGPIAWVVTGEIFPLKTRAKSLSMTTATNWLLNWALSFSTPYLVNYGPGNANLQSKIFFIWFACCFLCIGFVYFMIYETKGLTLEEVDELYNEIGNEGQGGRVGGG